MARTLLCCLNSALKSWFNFFACRICTAFVPITYHAMMEKITSAKMMTLASGVACFQTYTNSYWLDAAARKQTGMFMQLSAKYRTKRAFFDRNGLTPRGEMVKKTFGRVRVGRNVFVQKRTRWWADSC